MDEQTKVRLESVEHVARQQRLPSTVRVDPLDLRDLLNALAESEAQNTRLQTRMDEIIEAQPHRRVAAFHAMGGEHDPTTPTVPPDEIVRLRLRLIAEEFFELLDAALSEEGSWLFPGCQRAAVENVERMISAGAVRVDLPTFVDALADIDYVVEGSRLNFGVHGPPIATAVHEANMSKSPPAPGGKYVKPASWRAPDVEGLLREQGWKP